MRSVLAGTKRETLVREINNALLQWPELERRIFYRAHYFGQSQEAISHSFRLDREQVGMILERCQRRLYASLRSFYK
jgi:DNA-directed RNA polymerase specialized sigma24 family protein